MADASVSISGRVKSFITVCAFVAIVFNWWPTLDALAENYLSDTIQSNLIVFGVVRSLNGVISVVQSAEVGVGVAGVGLGEIFDPVNDLVERFSGLLLVTLTALGVQQVILLFTTSVILKGVFYRYCHYHCHLTLVAAEHVRTSIARCIGLYFVALSFIRSSRAHLAVLINCILMRQARKHCPF